MEPRAWGHADDYERTGGPDAGFLALSPYGKHAIEREVGTKARLFQAFLDFARYIAPARQFVRAAGVMKQPAAASEHACEFVVEHLRVQLPRDAEARRVMEQGIHRGIGNLRDGFRHIAVGH